MPAVDHAAAHLRREEIGATSRWAVTFLRSAIEKVCCFLLTTRLNPSILLARLISVDRVIDNMGVNAVHATLF